MSTQEPTNALNPDPAAIVSLVEKLVQGMWPRSDFDRKAWFESHGLVSGAAWDEATAAPAIAHYQLRTPMAGGEIASSWTSYHNKFLGISMQVYSSMQTDNPSTRQGYEDIHNRLTALYGPGVSPWHDPIVQACVWTVNARRIVIRFFNLQHSGVMISVDDAGLASASEAEARRRNAIPHWNDSAEAVSPYVMPKLRA